MIWKKSVVFLMILAFQNVSAQSFNFVGNDTKILRETLERKINILYPFVAHMRVWAHITDTIDVYALPVESAKKIHEGRIDASIERINQTTLAIVLDERIVFCCPEEGLKAIVAHEFGHAICGHHIEGKMPTGEVFEKLQAEADAVALTLVGKGAVREMLEWLNFSPAFIEARLKKAETVLMLNETGAISLFPKTK